MNIEQLKLILETLNAAGDNAYQLGVIYILSRIIDPVLLFSFLMSALFVGKNVLLRYYCQQDFLDNIRRAAGCSYPYGDLTTDDKNEVLEAINRGKNNQPKEQ